MDDAAVAITVTPSLAQVLYGATLTLAISTYQADRVIVSQVADEQTITMHLLNHRRPMGIAFREDVIAVGEMQSISALRDHPQLWRDGTSGFDGHYLPLWRHETADLMIHEMVYCESELWFVNTSFSCIATLDRRHNFRPWWAPPFVSELVPEDRCHLNGLAVRDGAPAFVSCLAESNSMQGWRDASHPAGLIIDVNSGATVIDELDFPHSPRWHAGRLWFLQSSQGLLCVSDIDDGRADTVAALPGFARGLAIWNGLAFVGLSKDRHQPEGAAEQQCGVWMVDLNTGNVVGTLEIHGVVTELFDVQLIPGRRRITFGEGDDATSHSYVFSPLVTGHRR